jgi:hypothetical protein
LQAINYLLSNLFGVAPKGLFHQRQPGTEGIYAEPEYNFEEGVLRADALRALSISKAKQFLRPGFTNEVFVRLKRAIESLPQKELDRVEKIIFSSGSKLHSKSQRAFYSPTSGEVVVRTEPLKGKSLQPMTSLFHEIAHARHVPSNPFRERASKIAGKPMFMGGIRLNRKTEGLVEEFLDVVSDLGKRKAKIQGKRFYLDDPREILARKMADNIYEVTKGGSRRLSEKEYDALYRRSLKESIQYVRSKAPKVSKISLEKAKEGMEFESLFK